jgi:IclR family transcriptional regulator, acetate operon repressor
VTDIPVRLDTRPSPDGAGRQGGVQSVERAFQLIEQIAAGDGSIGLSRLAAVTGLPLPTIHRLLRTLIRLGYVRQEESRRYVLGPRLIFLGEAATRSLGAWSAGRLRELAAETGESANLAVLQGDEVLYVAQVAGGHSMRMFTEPGRRVMPHCTAVGKVLLAALPEAQVRAILTRTGMVRYTPATVVRIDDLVASLAEVRALGYAIDDGEQEVGVRCVAARVPDAPALTAVSVSGPLARLTDAALAKITPSVLRSAAAIGDEMRVGRRS